MTTARQRRSKQRERRAASRRLPPARGRGRRFQTGGRPGAVRLVGVGQFAQGMARRADGRRQAHGARRLRGAVAGGLVAAVLVLWIVARLAGHL